MPEEATNIAGLKNTDVSSDAVRFAMFMRFLAPPTTSTSAPGGVPSIANGSQVFNAIGCAFCHTPTLRTGPSALTVGLSNANANLFSDLLVHHMGSNLADGVSQGRGSRRVPLSASVGARTAHFLLHNGRSRDLVDAINQQAS
jgi:CxxC motif-containing protein (DUF1111 family)